MLVFGFAAGLPYTLADRHAERLAGRVGDRPRHHRRLSWIGLAYAFKFLWSPLVDRVRCRARAARAAARLAAALPGDADRDLLRRCRCRPAACARLVRAGRGDRRLRLGDAGRGDRRLAHRRRRRAGAGRDPLLHLPVRLPHRGADRRRAGAGPVGAGQLADRLRDHGRLHGADHPRHLAGARHAARPIERELGEARFAKAGAIEPKLRAIGLAIVGARLGCGRSGRSPPSWRGAGGASIPATPTRPSRGDFTKTMGPWIVAATVILPALVAAVFNWLKARAAMC
jgi:PAT family beta-lactamase induction signal transducer AmpG